MRFLLLCLLKTALAFHVATTRWSSRRIHMSLSSRPLSLSRPPSLLSRSLMLFSANNDDGRPGSPDSSTGSGFSNDRIYALRVGLQQTIDSVATGSEYTGNANKSTMTDSQLLLSIGLVLHDLSEMAAVWSGTHTIHGAGSNSRDALPLRKGLLEVLRFCSSRGVNNLIVQSNDATVLDILRTTLHEPPVGQSVSGSTIRNLFDVLVVNEISSTHNRDAVVLAERASNVRNEKPRRNNERVSKRDIRSTSNKDRSNKDRNTSNNAVDRQERNKPTRRRNTARDGEYLLRFDGGSRGNPGISGAGMVLYAVKSNEEVWSGSEFVSTKGTVNEAEYAGLLHGLERAKTMGVSRLHVQGDSLLVVKQMRGEWQVKAQNLKPIFIKCKELTKAFDTCTFEHIPRNKNERADELANIAMDNASLG